MPVTSTPSSTSQAAVRNVDGAVLSWWKWPVSNEMPAYRAAAACGENVQPERAGDVADELAGAARGAAHERQLAVARVVVMVVDVDGDVSPAGQRQAVRIPRVERVERGVRRRRAAAHAPGGQQDVAEGQELVLRDVQIRRDAELREEVEHAGRRAERVGVRLLVDGERDALLAAHAPAQRVEVGGERLHASSSPASASSAVTPPPSASSVTAFGSSPGTRISCASSPRTSASRLSARSMRRALSSVSS